MRKIKPQEKVKNMPSVAFSEEENREEESKKKEEQEQERRNKNASTFEEPRDPTLLRSPKNEKRSHSQERVPPDTPLTDSSNRSASESRGGGSSERKR